MKKALISLTAVVMAGMLFATPVMADAPISKFFTDLNNNTYGFWAIDEIDSLYSQGVVRGVGNNKFAPQLLMERGDFVLMLENAFKLPTIQVNMYNFIDVPKDSYYFTAINNARGNGIIPDDPTFRPESPITRVAAFNMLYNTMHLYGCVGNNGSTDTSMYKDAGLLLNVQDKIAVGTLTKLGVVAGSNGYLKPNDTVTRAEMSVMLCKALDIYKASGQGGANVDVTQTKKPVLSGVEGHLDENRDKSETLKITEAYKAPEGEETDLDNVDILIEDGVGVTVEGEDTVLNINKGKAGTSYPGAKLFAALAGGKLNVVNGDITADGRETVGIYTDADSSLALEATKVFARGDGSNAIYAAGNVELTDSVLQSVKGDTILLQDGANADITSCDIKAEKGYDGIRVVNGDTDYKETTINLTDTTFKGTKNAAAVIVDNAKTVINIKNTRFEGFSYLLETTSNYITGMLDTEVTINLDEQKLEGDLVGDGRAVVNLNLKNGSYYKGCINNSNTTKSFNLTIGEGSVFELTDTCHVDALIIEDERVLGDEAFGDVIHDMGNIIYYNAENDLNDYLNEETFSLRNGGELRPE